MSTRGRYRNGLESRRRILIGAAQSFGRRGFAGATLRQIAAEVGVAHGSLVQHFGSKDELLLAVLRLWDEDLTDSLPELHGVAFLRGLGDLVRGHAERRPYIELFLTISVEASDPSHPAHDYIRARATRVRERVVAELKVAASSGDVLTSDEYELECAARELLALMNGLEMQWLLDPDVDLGGIFQPYLNQWLYRLGPMSTSPAS